LQPDEVKGEISPMLGTVLLLGICVLLLGYLLAALLWPENF
jgi:K+-transporting ATPase KdpF subunit